MRYSNVVMDAARLNDEGAESVTAEHVGLSLNHTDASRFANLCAGPIPDPSTNRKLAPGRLNLAGSAHRFVSYLDCAGT
jgi:hypothetical protein